MPYSNSHGYVYFVDKDNSDLDLLATFETSASVLHGTQAPTRYAVRQVLDQELQKANLLRENTARQARFRAGNPQASEDYIFDNKENSKVVNNAVPAIAVKRDFFGRVIQAAPRPLSESDGNSADKRTAGGKSLGRAEAKIWVTYHEGMNNAVRKPITLDELLRGL